MSSQMPFNAPGGHAQQMYAHSNQMRTQPQQHYYASGRGGVSRQNHGQIGIPLGGGHAHNHVQTVLSPTSGQPIYSAMPYPPPNQQYVIPQQMYLQNQRPFHGYPPQQQVYSGVPHHPAQRIGYFPQGHVQQFGPVSASYAQHMPPHGQFKSQQVQQPVMQQPQSLPPPRKSTAVVIRDPNTNEDVTSQILAPGRESLSLGSTPSPNSETLPAGDKGQAALLMQQKIAAALAVDSGPQGKTNEETAESGLNVEEGKQPVDAQTVTEAAMSDTDVAVIKERNVEVEEVAGVEKPVAIVKPLDVTTDQQKDVQSGDETVTTEAHVAMELKMKGEGDDTEVSGEESESVVKSVEKPTQTELVSSIESSTQSESISSVTQSGECLTQSTSVQSMSQSIESSTQSESLPSISQSDEPCKQSEVSQSVESLTESDSLPSVVPSVQPLVQTESLPVIPVEVEGDNRNVAEGSSQLVANSVSVDIYIANEQPTVSPATDSQEVADSSVYMADSLLGASVESEGYSDVSGNISPAPESLEERTDVDTGVMAVTDDEKLRERNVPDEEKEMQHGETDAAKLAARGDASPRDSPVTVGTIEVENDEDEEDEEEQEEQEVQSAKGSDFVIIYSNPEQWTPKNREGEKKYNRDFLLQFQNKCTMKPLSLPNVDCVLTQMVPSTAHGPPRQAFNQRKPYGKERDDPFVPQWQQKDRSRQHPRQKGQGGMQKVKKVIQPAHEPIQIKRSETAWLPSSQRSVELEDKERLRNEEVVRKARGILNKLTPEKFHTLTEQMQQLDISSEERLRSVIDLIFEKAVAEPSFSVAYANLCACLMQVKVSVGEQGDTEGSQAVSNLSFRKVLLTRCQKEFEKDKELPSKQKMQELIDACETEEEKIAKKDELELSEFHARKRSLGNIRFIGELFKLHLLTEPIMHECIMKLLTKSTDHESLECMCRLMTTVGKDLDVLKAKTRMDQYFDRIGKIIAQKKMATRVLFMLQDVLELRKNNWVPRREDNKPKTLSQINLQAQAEELHQQKTLQLHQSSQQKSGSSAGQYGDRKRGVISKEREAQLVSGRVATPQSDDSWILQTGKNRPPPPVDAAKFSQIASKSRNETNRVGSSASLRPATTKQWGQGSRGSGSSSPSLNDSRKAGRGRGTGKESQGPRRPSGGPPREKMEKEKKDVLAAVSDIIGTRSQEALAPQAEKKSRSASPTQSFSTALIRQESEEIQQLSDDELEKKVLALVDEYCNVGDLKEAIECVKDLHLHDRHNLVVSHAVNCTLERTGKDRRLVASLLKELLNENILTTDDYFKGMNEVFESADYMLPDIPYIWRYLGESVGIVAIGGKVLSDRLQEAMRLVSEYPKTATFAVQFVRTLEEEQGPVEIGQIVLDMLVRDPLKRALIEAQDNKDIHEWIRRNLLKDECKSPPVIRALTTAVYYPSLTKVDDRQYQFVEEEIESQIGVLKEVVGSDEEQQLNVLFGLQTLTAKTEPEGLLSDLFEHCHQRGIVAGPVFRSWLDSNLPLRHVGKQRATTGSRRFFDFLKTVIGDGEAT